MANSAKWARLVLALCASEVSAEPGFFSVSGLDGWGEQTFRDKTATQYRLVRESNAQVLEADCKASASGRIWKGRIDLLRTPVLAWRWKVENIYPGVAEHQKSGDDFPARVYVVLDGGLAVWRTRSLVYVWSSTGSKGSDWPGAYTTQAHVVALRSGRAEAGRWMDEQRDVRADFKRYFGLDVTQVDGVAVMTDCDDAGGATRAWYGDVIFSKGGRVL